MGIRTIAIMGIVLLTSCSVGWPSTPTSTSTSQNITEHVKVVHGPANATAVLLPVTIHGKGPFIFELDTGASVSLIVPSLAKQFGLPQAGRSQTISGIGGVQQATPVTISNWQTGPIRLPATTIVSANMPRERGSGLDGLIGSDVWSRFGKFTLDYSSGTVTVYKQIALAASAR